MSILNDIVDGIRKLVVAETDKIETKVEEVHHDLTDIPPAEIAAVLDEAEKKKGKGNWRKSEVDLLDLIKRPSTPAARKQLAAELGYPEEFTGTPEQNIWLHKHTMAALSQRGLRLPE